MLSGSCPVNQVEVGTAAKLAPYLGPALFPGHVAGCDTCRLNGPYPGLVSWDSPTSDGASVWLSPCLLAGLERAIANCCTVIQH